MPMVRRCLTHTPSRYNIQWEIKFLRKRYPVVEADRHQYPLVPSGL